MINSGSNTYYSNTAVYCSNKNCRRYTALIAGSIVGGGFAIVIFLLCIFHCIHRYRNRSSQFNVTFTHEINISEINQFKSGIWTCRYLRHGIWHGPNSISLFFDSQLFEVTGSGSDELGTFNITGTYSLKTTRMVLTKVYQINPLEHRILIKLIWNSRTRQFEGKRYLQCKTYREEYPFELKFNRLLRNCSNERI